MYTLHLDDLCQLLNLYFFKKKYRFTVGSLVIKDVRERDQFIYLMRSGVGFDYLIKIFPEQSYFKVVVSSDTFYKNSYFMNLQCDSLCSLIFKIQYYLIEFADYSREN